ncbi:MAG: 30S ribosomal protein S12 methylthiotransferase RimO [Myxococcales bacterium]|nr:MAG: 30S ribosomal protein S12 methylthiotransferase RimO [Myxococcales bacterium]
MPNRVRSTTPSSTEKPLTGSDSIRSVHFISLGCPKNRVDTEVMLGVSQGAGFIHENDAKKAEVIVVNTCGFIDAAKEESIDTILEMARYKEEGKCQKLVVTGCLSQRYPEELANQLPEVDHFLGSSDMLKLKTVLSSTPPRMLVGNPMDYVYRSDDPRALSSKQHSVWVKIAEGCNRYCSFCAIPGIRGKQRSRPVADVVQEVSRLVASGSREINIVSQDTIAYGRDLQSKSSLEELIVALEEVHDLAWLRLFYLYPEKMTDQLIELFRQSKKLLPYVDMPLQHASNRMLRLMSRGHGGQRIYRVVERLKQEIPDACLRSAFIVGHPGETDADFDELKKFVSWAEFDHVGVFLFSKEDGTPSSVLKEQVPREVAKRRAAELMALQNDISKRKLRDYIGKTLEVMVEGLSDESDLLLEGRHRGQAPDIDGKVYLANGTAKAGDIVQAHVTDAADYDLLADIIDGGSKPRHLPIL